MLESQSAVDKLPIVSVCNKISITGTAGQLFGTLVAAVRLQNIEQPPLAGTSIVGIVDLCPGSPVGCKYPRSPSTQDQE